MTAGVACARHAPVTCFAQRTRLPVAVTDLVIAECYFALRHHHDVPHRKAIAALMAFVSDARIRYAGVGARVLKNMPDKEAGAGLVDRLMHGGHESDDIVVLTFDRAAARLPGAQLLG